jgi:hypothetical protein
LNKKNFNAKTWLQVESQPTGSHRYGNSERIQLPNIPPVDDLLNFKPDQYFSRGWKGEGLSNKSIIKVQKVIRSLYDDARKQFRGFYNRNRSLKYSIYEEFQQYCSQFNIDQGSIDSFGDFWEVIKDYPRTPLKSVLDPFVEIYSYRAVIFYLYRLKFMLEVCRSVNANLGPGDISNPNAFVSNIFKKGGSLELNCESLQSHLYSWYRPHQSLTKPIQGTLFHFEELKVDEIFKATEISSFCPSIESLPLNGTKSHAISQSSFGCFVNDLIIKLPIWLKKERFMPQKLVGDRLTPNAVRTKYTGNFLDSFYQSHWLAQNDRIEFKYNDLICPDFINSDFLNGNFTRHCQEIQFMSFVLEVANFHDISPLQTLSQIVNNKYNSQAIGKADNFKQISFFNPTDTNFSKSYDRIILNLTNLPKKNPHHYLLNQIVQNIEELNHDGLILVFSNQKLFVPSQADKVEQLLKEVQIEAHFNMESLKGKGEITNYLYVFSKRALNNPVDSMSFNSSLNVFYNNTKESCLTFRWSGELATFQKFDLFVNELNKFFEKKSSSSASIFTSDLDENLQFHFHQDAVVEGKLLSSNNTAEDHITHPTFFNNLTKACSPLEQFFAVETLENQKTNQYTDGLLGINNSIEEQYPIVLIVKHINPKDIQLELIPSNTYKAKMESYGTAFAQYFGLIPKFKDIDLNVFREFFESQIGRQIIQLCLGGSHNKIKSKLRELLLPKFFLSNRQIDFSAMDRHIPGFQLDSISKSGSDVLRHHYHKFNEEIVYIENEDPRQALSMLTTAKLHLEQSLQMIKEGPTKNIFQNNIVIESLINAPKLPIHTGHPDVYTKLLKTSQQELRLPITGFDLSEKNGKYCLEVLSYDEKLAEIYSEEKVLEFIRFIMESAMGKSFLDVFFYIEVPKAEYLVQTINSHRIIAEAIEELYNSTSMRISNLITKHISQSYC